MFFSLFALFAGSVLCFNGRLTYFAPGLGACGGTNSGSDMIVAINAPQYEGTCGRSVCVSYNGKSVNARIVDRCADCPHGALDGSPSVFRNLAGSLTAGVLSVDWNFGSCSKDESTSEKTTSSTQERSSTSQSATSSTSSSSSSRTSTSSTGSQSASSTTQTASSSESSTSTSSESSSEKSKTTSAEKLAATVSFLPLSQRTACYISR